MTTSAMPATAPVARPAPTTSSVPATGSAAIRERRLRMLQVALFTIGAVLMPGGLVAVGFGWWGAAHTRYAYDQFPYLLSGGLLGVCLTTLGGFLYFGAWQAKAATDQRNATRQLTEAMLTLADVVSRQAQGPGPESADPAARVVAGANGATVHRRDCALIARREDLRALTPADAGLSRCRVCNPADG